MIKNKLKIITIMLLTGSCSGEQLENGSLPGVSGEVPLSVHSLSTGIATRTSGTVLPQSTAIGFYVQALTTGEKDYYPTQNNVKGGCDSEDNHWKPLPTTPVWLNNQTAQLAVYAPYDKEQSNVADGSLDGKLTLTAALRSTDGSNELAAGRFAANNQSMAAPGGISVLLEHLYARVVFTFYKYPNYTAEARIKKIAWDGKDIYKAATYDLFGTGTGIATTTNTGISASAYTIAGSDDNRNLTFPFPGGLPVGLSPEDAATAGSSGVDQDACADLLLIPTHADFTTDGVLTVTVSTTTRYSTGTGPIDEDKVLSVPIPKELFSGDRRLKAGKRFNITVRLSVADLIIEKDDVLVDQWVTEEKDIDSKLD